MNIWITGSAGFLGSRLVQTLQEAGHAVLGISRRSTTKCENSEIIDLGQDDSVEKLKSLEEKYGRPEVFIHAAARMPGKFTTADFVRSNALSTAHLLDALAEMPPRQLIYTSTLNVYGRPEKNPVSETDIPAPVTLYALTKLWTEQLLERLQNKSNMLILRLPSLYGAGQADSFIDGLARLVMNNEPLELFARGRTIRDAIHVDIAIQTILNCIQNPPDTPFLRLNLGCGQAITTMDYAHALVSAFHSRSEIIPIDRTTASQINLFADISLARQRINFQPGSLFAALEKYAAEMKPS